MEYQEQEFIVKDFGETIDTILESDELEIDGAVVTDEEKRLIKEMNNSIIEIIRDRRI
jgi:hypothetical protein